MIFYFTGSGNSYSIAKSLQNNETLVSIGEAMRNQRFDFKMDSERVGFVFPIYYYNLPQVVVDFIERLTISSKPDYIYAIATCGGTTGAAIDRLNQLLEKKKLRLDASFSVVMPDNYVLMFTMPSQSKIVEMIQSSKPEVEQIKRHVENHDPGDFNEHKGIFPKAVTTLAYPLYHHGRKTAKFHVLDSCISCTLCEQVCPTRTITMDQGKPKWTTSTCSHCLACIHRCPVEAIQYGRKTGNRGRYLHPDM